MQGEIAASNGAGASPVRFGSPEFAADVLPQAQGAALARAAAAVGHDNAVSVLVRGAPGRSIDDYGEDAIVRLFTFQASTAHRKPCRVIVQRDGLGLGSPISAGRPCATTSIPPCLRMPDVGVEEDVLC